MQNQNYFKKVSKPKKNKVENALISYEEQPSINKTRSLSVNSRSNYFQNEVESKTIQIINEISIIKQQTNKQNNYIFQNLQQKQNILLNQESQSIIMQQSQVIKSNLMEFQEVCKSKEMQTILFQGNKLYNHLLLFNHSQFYYNSESLKYEKLDKASSNKFQLTGKLYDVKFDQNKNPKYLIQEGTFEIFLDKNLFILNGQGVEYCGKSNNEKYRGEFVNGKYKQNQENKTNFIRSQSAPIKKILIYDFQTGTLLNKDQENKQQNYDQKYIRIWCKYNEQISMQDIIILQQNGRLTSSIIDCYVYHLNLLSEEKYFKKDRNKQKTIDKILFLTSAFTTNFGDNYTFEKAKQLFEIELLQFQEMNFELKKIYSWVGFPINKCNYHWYFVLFDLKSGKCLIFDSLKNSISNINRNEKLLSTLSQLLQIQLLQIELSQYSGQQVDSYSCGYHICEFMKYRQEIQFEDNKEYQYNQKQIANILEQVITNKEL
ncbi:unnamed protein product [Paramecium sonneborni]|uniref:Ubiquitin-like protease family profile domain-containing protein n=1 Tax=Paramecium sonneborni TaxID=65129 RepID=A0A8S1RIT9_9CILI|nr:unnamed protein product [Paramecium sonneborni]